MHNPTRLTPNINQKRVNLVGVDAGVMLFSLLFYII